MIPRQVLCECNLHAGSYTLSENIINCPEDDNQKQFKMSLIHSVNQAVSLHLPEDLSKIMLDVEKPIQSMKEIEVHFPEPKVLEAPDTDIIGNSSEMIKAPLEAVMKQIEDHDKLYYTKADKALEIDDLHKWLTGGNKGMSIKFWLMIAGVIITMIMSIVLFVLWKRYSFMRKAGTFVAGAAAKIQPGFVKRIYDTFSKKTGLKIPMFSREPSPVPVRDPYLSSIKRGSIRRSTRHYPTLSQEDVVIRLPDGTKKVATLRTEDDVRPSTSELV
jgi:hypothetical protein